MSSCTLPVMPLRVHARAQLHFDIRHALFRALEAHGAAQLLGLAAGESGRDHGHAQQLLLKQRHAQRPPQHRLERGMQAIRRFPALPPVQIRMHHLAHDGPGPDDRHLHHDVVKPRAASCAAARTSARGSPPGTCRWCRPSAALRRPPDRRAAGAPGPPLRRRLRGSASGESSSTAIMPRPSRSTLMMPISAQSSLSHCTTTRPGMVAGSSGTTESSWPWQITMPPECWPRWRGRSCAMRYSSKNLRTRGWFRSRPASRNWRSVVSLGSFHSQVRTRLREPLERGDFEAQRLAHFARGGAAAIGDDVGGHGRAQLAEALVDVLDGALALVAAGQVDIDVGPLAALFGKEALEQQVHAHRIDGGDLAARSRPRCWRPSRGPAPGCRFRGRSARCPRRSGNSRPASASR